MSNDERIKTAPAPMVAFQNSSKMIAHVTPDGMLHIDDPDYLAHYAVLTGEDVEPRDEDERTG